MNIRDYWVKHHEARLGLSGFVTCARVVCADGFNVSVQASEYHYCLPKEYLPDGLYTAWELGFPSQHEPLLNEYAEDITVSPTRTVYPYVPTKVVNDMIEKHGGIDVSERHD